MINPNSGSLSANCLCRPPFQPSSTKGGTNGGGDRTDFGPITFPHFWAGGCCQSRLEVGEPTVVATGGVALLATTPATQYCQA